MRSTTSFLGFLALLIVSCTKNYPSGALRISDNDSNYSEDVLSVSKKINQSPFVAENYYLRGNTFFFDDKYETAIQDFRVAVELEPKNPLYRYRLAETYLEKDSADYLKAVEQLDEALSLKPDYSEAIFLKSKLLLARQQYKECDPLLKKLTTDKEFVEKARLLQVVSYKEQGDTLLALEIIDKVLANNPNHYDATMQKALFLLEKEPELAESWVDKALTLDEYSDEALYTKGLILQRKKQYADAEIVYNRAIKINPGHLFAIYNLAVIQAMFDNHEDVIDLCTQITEQDAGFVNAYILRGFSRASSGQKNAARSDYQAALEIDPNNELAIRYLNQI